MLIGPGPDRSSYAKNRILDPAAWAESEVPLLRDPRGLVTELHRIHLPVQGSALLGVLDAEGRLAGSASLLSAPGVHDGWEYRNALLAQFRRVVPDGLRRSQPTHTGVLMACRRGEAGWTAEDGAWMWALRDACGLHGLRCGAYLILTERGWRVLGDGRSGRSPQLGAQPQHPLQSVSSLPHRVTTADPQGPGSHVEAVGALARVRRAAGR